MVRYPKLQQAQLKQAELDYAAHAAIKKFCDEFQQARTVDAEEFADEMAEKPSVELLCDKLRDVGYGKGVDIFLARRED